VERDLKMSEELIKNIIKEIGINLIQTYTNVEMVAYGFKEVGGIKTDEPCLVIGVTEKLKEIALHPKQIVPKEILGVKTDVIQIGKIKSLSYTTRYRPCPGGVSVGHKDITAGTIGLPKVYKDNGDCLLLSNNHVLANCNDGVEGDAILQPGSYDAGHIEVDQLATLEEYIPIKWVDPSECSVAGVVQSTLNSISKVFKRQTRFYTEVEEPPINLVDAALARPLNGLDMKDTVLDIGEPQGLNFAPELGMKVHKTGRTSEHTTGEITQLYATISVAYSPTMMGKQAIFTDQIITDKMGDPGDSGSSMFDMDNYVTGLLFAGSDEATVFNGIENVFKLLEVDLE